MKIGIIAALTEERRRLLEIITEREKGTAGPFEFATGNVGTNTLYVMECGIGKVNAALGAAEMIRFLRPDAVISTGVAGGLDDSVGVMDVVAAKETAYHDVWCGGENALGQVQGLPLRFPAHKRLLSATEELHTNEKIHTGLICTGDKFITTREELETIKRTFVDALAVDMESAAIAHVCHLYNVPFLSFRIISDTPGADSHWQQYKNFWTELADRSFGVIKTFLERLPETLD